MAEVHEASRRGLIAQVRQEFVADKLGSDYFFMTERRFRPEGAEFARTRSGGNCDSHAHIGSLG